LHNENIIKQNPIQGGCKVLALVERGRKISFGEAWPSLELSGVKAYVIWCMKLMKGHKDKEGKSDTTHML
jgi:hypothetical protein